MTYSIERRCRRCGGTIERSMGTRGGRPREHCHGGCKPAKRRPSDVHRKGAPCRTCGGPIERSTGRGRPRLHCHSCRPSGGPRRQVGRVTFQGIAADLSLTSAHRAVLARAVEIAEAEGWSTRSLGRVVSGLRVVLDELVEGQAVALSRLHAVTGRSRGSQLTRMARVLGDHNLLVVDTASTMRRWIERSCATLPDGFRADIRSWLLVLAEGAPRARPRSPATIYVYFGRVRPHLLTWSSMRHQLREVTQDDVCSALSQLRGHQRAGAFVAMRSLFGFAKRRRLVFRDPTSRLHAGRFPARVLLPMTNEQIAAVQRVATTPAQRLIVALAGVHAARAATIRRLTLDDVDLAGRRICLDGHEQPLSPFMHHVLVCWLQHRQRTWPDTRNRHVLLSAASASSLGPVSNYYLKYHLLRHGVQLELIRGDRVLQEALASGADPLQLVEAFNLSSATAVAYADIARSLLEGAIEGAPAAGQPGG